MAKSPFTLNPLQCGLQPPCRKLLHQTLRANISLWSKWCSSERWLGLVVFHQYRPWDKWQRYHAFLLKLKLWVSLWEAEPRIHWACSVTMSSSKGHCFPASRTFYNTDMNKAVLCWGIYMMLGTRQSRSGRLEVGGVIRKSSRQLPRTWGSGAWDSAETLPGGRSPSPMRSWPYI